MKRVTSKQAFFGLCAGIVLSLAGTVFILYWANSQLEIRKDQINEKRTESQELDNNITRAKSLREQLDELSDIVKVSSEVLPSSKSQENIVGELLALASKRGLTLESISFEGASSDPTNPETSQAELLKDISGVYSLGIQTSITTDYENILQFLEDVENNKRQFEITDISIAPVPDTNQFDAQLTLVTYIQP